MREAPKQRRLETRGPTLYSFIQPQPKWTKIMNRKLKFPPPLLGAIGPGVAAAGVAG